MAGRQVEAAKKRTVAEQAAIDEKKKQLYVPMLTTIEHRYTAETRWEENGSHSGEMDGVVLQCGGEEDAGHAGREGRARQTDGTSIIIPIHTVTHTLPI